MKQKDKVCQFVSELEQYAVDCGMKKRVLDAISDVRRNMEDGISQDNVSELDRLVEYIAKQQDKSTQIGESVVSLEELQQKIRKYYEQCINDNELEKQRGRSGCRIFLEEAKLDMQDYAKVEVYFDEITQVGKFCDIFLQIGQKYARQTNQALDRYAESAAANYHYMMDNIRKMMVAVGFREITQKDFYEKRDSRYETVSKGCTEKSRRINGGEEEIADFAQEHMGGIVNIMKKQGRRRKNHKLMPLYALFACIVLFLGGQLLWRQMTKEPPKQTADITVENEKDQNSSGQKEDAVKKAISDLGTAISEQAHLEEGAAEGLSGVITGFGLLIFFAIAVPCIILLLIIWYLYARSVDKKYRAWICDDISGYLSVELDNFWKENLPNIRLDGKFQSLNEYMDKEYEKLISDVCGGIMGKNEEEGKQEKLRRLYSQWETIKREVG